MYIYTYLLILGLGGGPVGQPPLALNEKALYLPSHILQIKLCEGVMGFPVVG